MKKITTILFLALALVSLESNAQNNLSFSKVKLITSSDTVPIGKVWKIESVGRTSNFTVGGSTTSNWILINNHILEFNTRSTNGNGTTWGIGTTLPLWIPEGTSLNIFTNTELISVIEYTVIQ